jgi:hypothetical protein
MIETALRETFMLTAAHSAMTEKLIAPKKNGNTTRPRALQLRNTVTFCIVNHPRALTDP